MMKSIRTTTVILLLLLLGPLAATVARADHGHFGGYHGYRGGFGVGVGLGLGVGLALDGWPLYYPYGYYPYGYYPYSVYPPVVVTQQAAPTVYIEQGNPAPAQDSHQQSYAPAQGQSTDWYYCRKPAGYYPYVRSCADGWQRVPSQPQPQN